MVAANPSRPRDGGRAEKTSQNITGSGHKFSFVNIDLEIDQLCWKQESGEGDCMTSLQIIKINIKIPTPPWEPIN